MKLLAICLALLGTGFVALMVLAPSGTSPDREKRDYQSRLFAEGPSGVMAWLGDILAFWAPGVEPVASSDDCSGAHAMLVPAEAGKDHRLLRPALRAADGEGARVVYQPRDPREDGGEGSYVLCLRAEGSQAELPSDCQSQRPEPNGTLPVGPNGGCVSWEGFGTPPRTLAFH